MRVFHWLGFVSVCCAVIVGYVLFGRTSSARAQSVPDAFIAPGLPLAQRQEQERLDVLASLDFLRDRPPRLCRLPAPTTAAELDEHRSLFVHDRATLDALGGKLFSLKRTLGQIAAQVNAATDASTASALGIFRQFWDTQNSAPGRVPTPSSPHCSDNSNTLNGFPITCRTVEGMEADDTTEATLDAYHPIALVNRFDRAEEGFRNCGEYRIIYARTPGNPSRLNFMIFEAVLPNPKPGCRESCMPVARYWRDLSSIDDPALRAKRLSDFFYRTDPETSASIDVPGLEGFRPAVHVDHYSATGVRSSYGSSGSGQIRTNEFLKGDPRTPWVLREYKTLIDCSTSPCRFDMVPSMVKTTPYGELWNEDLANGAVPDSRAEEFQASLVEPRVVASLADERMTHIGYPVEVDLDAAQSTSLKPTSIAVAFPDNYAVQFHAATGAVTLFRNNLAAAAMAHGLSADQLVHRAQTQSCAGCHKPHTFGLDEPDSIGPTLTPLGTVMTSWPLDAGFFHVSPRVGNPVELASATVFGSGEGHALSPALRDVFLPERKNFFLSQLNLATCVCMHSFRFLPPASARRLLDVQEKVFSTLLPELDALRAESFALRQGTDLTPDVKRAFEAETKQLDDALDQRLDAELAATQLLPPKPSVTAQVLRLDAVLAAGGKPELEAAARQKAVLDIAAEEPPRRTVTGSFAMH